MTWLVFPCQSEPIKRRKEYIPVHPYKEFDTHFQAMQCINSRKKEVEKEEPLISLFPKTDFEKLLFALKYIDELKKENSLLKREVGLMKSDFDLLLAESKDARKLSEYKRQLKDMAEQRGKKKRFQDKIV